MSRATGSSRGTVKSGRAWLAFCLAGTRTTRFLSRVTIPCLPSCVLRDLLREVLVDDFVQSFTLLILPRPLACVTLLIWGVFFLTRTYQVQSVCAVAGFRHLPRLKQAPGSAACCFRKDRKQLRRKVDMTWSSSEESCSTEFFVSYSVSSFVFSRAVACQCL